MSESLNQSRMDCSKHRLQKNQDSVHPNFLQEALKHVSDAFLFFDMSGILKIANASAFQLFSMPGDSAIGSSYWDLFADDYFGFSMRESLRFGLSQRLIYKNQRFLELEITTFFLFKGALFEHGLGIVARDIGERQRLFTLLQQAERLKILGEATAQIAHEIRNPLGGIRGFASLLFRDLKDQIHLQEMAKAIIDATKRLEELVANILHYARPMTPKLNSIDLGRFVKEVAKFVKVDPAFPSSIQMVFHIPNHPILVPIDSDLMKSALLNLIFNAIQAMQNGGILTISLFQLEGCCQIAIHDTGIGMDAEVLNALFSPYFTTKQKGNGLGLIEAEKIIKAHKGSIEVRSQKAKGSTFTITLSLRR
ncbi:MAG TPA: ATP-binding protein [Chlamydiales bacterium]|nr:ATP-binding protein [Chlamydiales bacterium]